MGRVIIQPDTEATRQMVRNHAEAFMRGGGDHKVVIAEMRRHTRLTKAERRARKGAR